MPNGNNTWHIDAGNAGGTMSNDTFTYGNSLSSENLRRMQEILRADMPTQPDRVPSGKRNLSREEKITRAVHEHLGGGKKAAPEVIQEYIKMVKKTRHLNQQERSLINKTKKRAPKTTELYVDDITP